MRTLKFNAQPTKPSSFVGSSPLLTTAERALMKSFSTSQTTKQCWAVVGSWEEPPNLWLTVPAKNAFVCWAKFKQSFKTIQSIIIENLRFDNEESSNHIFSSMYICIFTLFASLASLILLWTLMSSLCFQRVFYSSVEWYGVLHTYAAVLAWKTHATLSSN